MHYLQQQDDTPRRAMRHPLPPGALAGATLRIAQGALDAETTIIRQVAIKDFELAYQKIKMLFDQSLPTVLRSVQQRNGHLATVAQGYGEGGKITGTAHQAEATDYLCCRWIHNGRINAKELALKAVSPHQTYADYTRLITERRTSEIQRT